MTAWARHRSMLGQGRTYKSTTHIHRTQRTSTTQHKTTQHPTTQHNTIYVCVYIYIYIYINRSTLSMVSIPKAVSRTWRLHASEHGFLVLHETSTSVEGVGKGGVACTELRRGSTTNQSLRTSSIMLILDTAPGSCRRRCRRHPGRERWPGRSFGPQRPSTCPSWRGRPSYRSSSRARRRG